MSHVQVVLKNEVDNLGGSGDLVRVRAGYARNFLIPRGVAVLATPSNIKQVEHERRLALKRAEALRKKVEEAAVKFKGLRVQVAKEAGEEGKLFGSVTSQEVAEAMARAGIEVDKRKIGMPEDIIKTVGEYPLSVDLGQGVKPEFTLGVVTKS